MAQPSDIQQKNLEFRLEALRTELFSRGLDGFIVPRSDEFQGEYVPPHAERLAWLTGFDGSAGAAVVLADRAAIFVDGRYTLQVKDQIHPNLFEVVHLVDTPPSEWLAGVGNDVRRIGYDPWLHTADAIARLEAACQTTSFEMEPVETNAVDAIWSDQPPAPNGLFAPHPMEFAGEESKAKRESIAEGLIKKGAAAVIITLPDSVAWLLNIRGSDVPRSPLPLAFAILHADATVSLFADAGKINDDMKTYLGPEITHHRRDELSEALQAFDGKKVMIDPATASKWFFTSLEAVGAEILRESDPCQLPKACKNGIELDGTRAAHLRDGAALTKFLAWFDSEAPGGNLTELGASQKLETFRRESNMLRDLSFDTISGGGPNGAVVHYRVTPESNRTLEPGQLYLVDSGGQYPDGTTDVTRTVAIGEPTSEMRRNFTLVLKGHIALARARYPAGTSGSQLDILARQYLWADGLDYDHGTGHGVGSYLSVHEGPQRISKMPNAVALMPGMIVSNEPGYYQNGDYGIRIENLVVVRESVQPANGQARSMLEFETLTLAPIDRTLIELDLLTAEECAWIDDYHARVSVQVGPALDPEARQWLDMATAPLERH